MDMNGIRNLKYTSLSSVQRKLNKSNANDDNNGEEEFDVINNRLRKKRSIELKDPEYIFEDDTTLKPIQSSPAIINEQNIKVLSDQSEDFWKRAMLFIDKK